MWRTIQKQIIPIDDLKNHFYSVVNIHRVVDRSRANLEKFFYLNLIQSNEDIKESLAFCEAAYSFKRLLVVDLVEHNKIKCSEEQIQCITYLTKHWIPEDDDILSGRGRYDIERNDYLKMFNTFVKYSLIEKNSLFRRHGESLLKDYIYIGFLEKIRIHPDSEFLKKQLFRTCANSSLRTKKYSYEYMLDISEKDIFKAMLTIFEPNNWYG